MITRGVGSLEPIITTTTTTTYDDMPDDATEGVTEHSSRLQPSINVYATVTAFRFRYPMFYPGEMKARVSPVQGVDKITFDFQWLNIWAYFGKWKFSP